MRSGGGATPAACALTTTRGACARSSPSCARSRTRRLRRRLRYLPPRPAPRHAAHGPPPASTTRGGPRCRRRARRLRRCPIPKRSRSCAPRRAIRPCVAPSATYVTNSPAHAAPRRAGPAGAHARARACRADRRRWRAPARRHVRLPTPSRSGARTQAAHARWAWDALQRWDELMAEQQRALHEVRGRLTPRWASCASTRPRMTRHLASSGASCACSSASSRRRPIHRPPRPVLGAPTRGGARGTWRSPTSSRYGCGSRAWC